jgi:hypothetical protein
MPARKLLQRPPDRIELTNYRKVDVIQGFMLPRPPLRARCGEAQIKAENYCIDAICRD